MNAFVDWLVMNPWAYVVFWCVAIPTLMCVIWKLLGGAR